MIPRARRLPIIGLLGACLALAASTGGVRAAAAEPAATATVPNAIPLELWDRPRSGRAVLAVPAVRAAIAALLAKPDARLFIRHPAGPEGTLQAEEIRTWLIAHAIEPGRVALRPQAAARQSLSLEVVQ